MIEGKKENLDKLGRDACSVKLSKGRREGEGRRVMIRDSLVPADKETLGFTSITGRLV